jgi:hypothetical protein
MPYAPGLLSATFTDHAAWACGLRRAPAQFRPSFVFYLFDAWARNLSGNCAVILRVLRPLSSQVRDLAAR